MAFLGPSLMANVVADSLTAAFTPVYIQVRETQGVSAARRLFDSATAASVVLVFAVTCLLLTLTPFGLRYLGAGFSAEKLALTRSLVLLPLPIVFLNAGGTPWSAAL